MNSRTAIKTLLALVLGLPLAQAVLHWVQNLLSAMSDTGTAMVLGHLQTALSVTWLLGLVGLLVALALQTLDEPPHEQ